MENVVAYNFSASYHIIKELLLFSSPDFKMWRKGFWVNVNQAHMTRKTNQHQQSDVLWLALPILGADLLENGSSRLDSLREMEEGYF